MTWVSCDETDVEALVRRYKLIWGSEDAVVARDLVLSFEGRQLNARARDRHASRGPDFYGHEIHTTPLLIDLDRYSAGLEGLLVNAISAGQLSGKVLTDALHGFYWRYLIMDDDGIMWLEQYLPWIASFAQSTFLSQIAQRVLTDVPTMLQSSVQFGKLKTVWSPKYDLDGQIRQGLIDLPITAQLKLGKAAMSSAHQDDPPVILAARALVSAEAPVEKVIAFLRERALE